MVAVLNEVAQDDDVHNDHDHLAVDDDGGLLDCSALLDSFGGEESSGVALILKNSEKAGGVHSDEEEAGNVYGALDVPGGEGWVFVFGFIETFSALERLGDFFQKLVATVAPVDDDEAD